MNFRSVFQATKRRLVSSALTTLAILLIAPAGHSQVKDGSFTTTPTTRGVRGVWNLNAGSNFGAWSVKQGRINLLSQGTGQVFQDKTHAGNSVELLAGDFKSRAIISQKVPTEVGKWYTILFSYAGRFDSTTYGKQGRLVVRRGQDNIEFSSSAWGDYIKPSAWSMSNIQWKQGELRFLAQTDSTLIEFESTNWMPQTEGILITSVQMYSEANAPSRLNRFEAPLPKDLDQFVRDRNRAIQLGKALFWDMQVGSDGRTACASCHNAAGVDHRFVNTLEPGAPGSQFGPQLSGQDQLRAEAVASFRGANKTLTASDFPFHRVARPLGDRRDNKVLFDTKEIVGSQGVVRKDFVQIIPGSPQDEGQLVNDPIFNISGANTRQVTARNSPTTINAVFFDRLFWDGRANHYFNGVNVFGNLDPNARVLKTVTKTVQETKKVWVSFLWWGWWQNVTTTKTVQAVEPTKILLNNAALASQAVGPPLSGVEMSWHNRDFRELGRKMLSLQPLALQKVASTDSQLGSMANFSGKGLRSEWNYARLIREAFHDPWWNSSETTAEGYTMMEANFSLYWGLSLMMYQSTLVSDEAPYDRFARGDRNQLSAAAKRGLATFLGDGKCINCHGGPEFAGATIRDVRQSSGPKLVENMVMGNGETAWYDNGFYNIGVRPTLEDISVGAEHPDFGPLSYSRQRQQGRQIDQSLSISPSERVAVNGAFKTPTLRNIELTGPYFHNGGARKLSETVEFYTRGADFFHQNIADIDPDVDGISELRGNRPKVQDLVEFMKSLTDERVRFQKAPFDHPELFLPNGHSGVSNGIAQDNLIRIPEVGYNGGPAILPFEELVK